LEITFCPGWALKLGPPAPPNLANESLNSTFGSSRITVAMNQIASERGSSLGGLASASRVGKRRFTKGDKGDCEGCQVRRVVLYSWRKALMMRKQKRSESSAPKSPPNPGTSLSRRDLLKGLVGLSAAALSGAPLQSQARQKGTSAD